MTDLQVSQSAAVATAVLWTLSAVAWTSAGKHIGALSVSFIRLPITCAMLVLYGWAVRGMALPTDATADAWFILGISGFFGFFLSDVCMFKAFLLIGPRLSLLIYALMPPMAAILSWVIYGDMLTWKDWLAMAVTLSGVAWVVLERAPGGSAEAVPRGQLVYGVALSVSAALLQAVAIVLAKQGLGDYDAGAAAFIRVLGGLAGYPLLLTCLGRWGATFTAMRNGRAMLIVFCGAVVGPFLGVVLNLVALRHCEAGVVATVVATMPVLILPFAIFLYHEKVTLRAAVGAVVSVIGVAILALPVDYFKPRRFGPPNYQAQPDVRVDDVGTISHRAAD